MPVRALPVTAAVEVAEAAGLRPASPLLLQETNNTVLWLRPEPVVAKVATHAAAQGDVRLELALAHELAARGAEIGRPVVLTEPVVHRDTGFVVTLWERLEGHVRAEVPDAVVADALRRLHDDLAATAHELPPFVRGVERARTALDDDVLMAAMSADDRAFLREAFDDSLAALEERDLDHRRLHGEPHDGNRILTADGLRWIDFESCCTGPLEWDLAFQPPGVAERFTGVDDELLLLLRRLNSARVATWCWAQARFPDMREHGEIHLSILRSGPPR